MTNVELAQELLQDVQNLQKDALVEVRSAAAGVVRARTILRVTKREEGVGGPVISTAPTALLAPHTGAHPTITPARIGSALRIMEGLRSLFPGDPYLDDAVGCLQDVHALFAEAHDDGEDDWEDDWE